MKPLRRILPLLVWLPPLAVCLALARHAAPDLLGANQLRHISTVDTAQRRPSAVLDLGTATIQGTVGSELTVPVRLDTAGAQISGADLLVFYPSGVVSLARVTFDDSPCTTLRRYNDLSGQVAIHCEMGGGTGSQIQQFAILHFQALRAGSGLVGFAAPQTSVEPFQGYAGQLRQTHDATIRITP